VGLFSLFARPNLQVLADRGDIDGLIRVLETSTNVNRARQAADALVRCGSEARHHLTPLLRHSQSYVREAAHDALRRILPAEEITTIVRQIEETNKVDIEIETQVAILRHPHEASAEEVLYKTLCGFGPSAVNSTIRLLSDRNYNVRYTAARVLESLPDSRAVKPLIKALADTDSYIRQSVLKALATNRDSQAIAPVLKFLKDDQLGVREAAAETLGALGAIEAVEPLIRMLANPKENETVKEAVAEALGRINAPASIEPLIAALSQTVRVRWKCIAALGRFRDDRAVSALIDQAEGGSQAAIEALSAIGDRRAADVFLKRLNDDAALVRRAAVVGLGIVGGPSAVEPILQLSDDYDSVVRNAVPGALERIGPAAVEPLTAALSDPRSPVRRVAADVLCRLEPQAPTPAILALRAVAAADWQAAGRLGDDAVPALLIALRDLDPSIRQGAAMGLTLVGWQPSTGEERITWAIARRAWDEVITLGPAAVDEAVECAAERLAEIYRTHPRGFLSGATGPAASEVVSIGRDLNDLGQMEVMRAAHARFAASCRHIAGAGRNLEILWDGIGQWRG
jgi:HEAT repeat protein